MLLRTRGSLLLTSARTCSLLSPPGTHTHTLSHFSPDYTVSVVPPPSLHCVLRLSEFQSSLSDLNLGFNKLSTCGPVCSLLKLVHIDLRYSCRYPAPSCRLAERTTPLLHLSSRCPPFPLFVLPVFSLSPPMSSPYVPLSSPSPLFCYFCECVSQFQFSLVPITVASDNPERDPSSVSLSQLSSNDVLLSAPTGITR